MATSGLLASIASGDEGAFVALVRKYQDGFFNLARRMLGDRAEAEDVVQRVFLRIFLKAASYRRDRNASTWLYRVLTNECIDAWRKRRNARALLRGPVGSADHRLAERTDLQAALGRVPAEARSILLLCYCEGLSYQEIARVRGVTVNTVKTQLQRAKRIMRLHLRGAE